jgi:hypothetical protein
LPRLRLGFINKQPLDFDQKILGGQVGHFSMVIKLNDKGVRAYMAAGGAKNRPRLDWQTRIGTVAKYSRDRAFAYVVWNGNHSCDRVPVHLIEPANLVAAVTESSPAMSLGMLL